MVAFGGRPVIEAVFTALLLAATGCTAGMRPPRDPAPEFAGPIRSRDVGEGGRVYIALCSACHRGRVNPRGYHWTPAQMRQQIRRGNDIMPPLPREVISDARVEAVLAYLAVSGALEGELPPEHASARVPHRDDAFAADAELEEEPVTDVDDATGPGDEPSSEAAEGLDDPH